jgi:hypothetical protein
MPAWFGIVEKEDGSTILWTEIDSLFYRNHSMTLPAVFHEFGALLPRVSEFFAQIHQHFLI